MKPLRQSISPIKSSISPHILSQTTPQKYFFSIWKLMSQVLELHNSLNQVRMSISEIQKFWKMSQYQLETSVGTIIQTFRGMLVGKDMEIGRLREEVKRYEGERERREREVLFNRCGRISGIGEMDGEEGEKVEVEQVKSKSKNKQSSDYLHVLQKQVQIIKQKLALLDASEQCSTKLITIKQVTELCTSREQEQGIKERYENMLKEEIEEEYNFQEDLLILKNFNLESTKEVERENDEMAKTSVRENVMKGEKRGDKLLDIQLKEIKQISKRYEQKQKDNKQNNFQVTQPFLKPSPDNQPPSPLPQPTPKPSTLLTLQFPISPKITLASLTPIKPSLPNQTQHYIGNYTFTGSFDQHHQRTGYGTLRKNTRDIYTGNWKKGVFDGWGKLVLNTSKFVEYSGEFKMGIFEGRGTLVFRNGDRFIGEVRRGRVEGEGTWYRGGEGGGNGEGVSGVWEGNVLVKRY